MIEHETLMGLEVELARFPIVVCRLSAKSETSAALASACDAYLAELGLHRGMFVCVQATGPRRTRSLRSYGAPCSSARCSRRSRAEAAWPRLIAVGSPSLRGFATSRALSHELPYPVHVAGTFDAALSWCAWQLRRSEPQAV